MTQFKSLLNGQQVVPVVVLHDAESTKGLAGALLDGGVNVIEITLRSDFALSAIELIKQEFKDMVVLAGTVNNEQDMQNAVDAGVDGIISPGLTPELLQAAERLQIPFMPGVATPSEILIAMQAGINECKLFPASVVGGVGALKAFSGPFSAMSFCPTGGIGADTYKEYLALDNVFCVGGSWLAPPDLIKQANWSEISARCRLN